jgi:potassium uptake TrkH family protein
MTREKFLLWLSRAMFIVAALAVVSLILEYGFYLGSGQERLLHAIDLAIVIAFLADAVIRFFLARRKLEFLVSRWPGLAIAVLLVSQFLIVAHFQGQGLLPAFLESRSVFSLAKGYIIVLQIYLVAMIIVQTVRANRKIATYRLHPARTVILSFLLIIFLGTMLLLTPRATGENKIPFIDAVFSATSAVCVTGLVVVDTGSYFTEFGQGVMLTLIQIGGLGLITLTAFFAIVLRRGLGVRESLVLRGMLTFESVGRIGTTLRVMIGLTFLTEGVGAILLFLATRTDFPTIAEAIHHSVFHAVSAFCNAGFSLYSTSFERYVGNLSVNAVMAALIVIGGIGFPVIMNLLGRRVLFTGTARIGPRYSVHSKLVLLVTAILLVVGTAGFYLIERHGVLADMSAGRQLMASFFGSVTARTAGFNTTDTASLAMPTLFLLAVLMFIGGSPGGTAGGVKTSTMGLVIASIGSIFTGRARVELFRRHIPDPVVREALVVVAMGIIVVSGGTFFLLLTENLTLSQVLFEVVSAFGTVGLSTGITPTLSPAAKVVLMLIMLTGRIGPLTLALAIGQRRERLLYDYPQERVVIG